MADNSPEPPATDDAPVKAYHSKRPHKKSRAGCKSCKQRKVKCDEARPTCRSCKLRNAECVYLNPPSKATTTTTKPTTTLTPPASNSVTSLPSPTSPTFFLEDLPNSPDATISSAVALSAFRGASPGIVSEPLYRPTAVDETDMKLLWFYTTYTCGSISIRDDRWPAERILRNILVPYAFRSPFLMDSVLALSSLHMQNLKQETDTSRGLVYRTKSFEGYRKAVEEADPDTYPALVANSLLVTALSSQVFRDPDSKDLYIIDWIVVWRGIGLIIDIVQMQTLVQTGLNYLFFRPPLDLNKSASFIPNQLLFMISSIQPGDPDYPHREMYYKTLKYVGSLYMNLQDGLGPVMTLRVIVLFTFLPDKFVELARLRRPRALVIIAYCAMFFKLIHKDVWWVAEIGERSIQDIYRHLSTEWDDLLRIPLMTIGLQERLDIARTILEDPCWAPNAPKDHQYEQIKSISWVDDLGRELSYDLEGKMRLADPESTDTPFKNKHTMSV
ncbi:hypothetical protein PT974_10191 [Cladobotryum mycophilum]|uniref:Zn(2)-C6 fungal-type domain-containing protein n=1 Tax=Cladobotryum mycophilum TaxID=491253 RepID=A0ABR0S954_9HYPO